eukprot:CAMPEP_0183337858 /NCGR_PEP_ID=MMETSP0164_2-20130417/5357_1 /TAXON_ID=221442 /ORGANISM="Coccolithus pelagicus ssp braarudi, Strain PLY182g" /LENGTH=240 /DNA_ID=CAMNT_0025507621 /DNA_START=38 /DNA_END=760 /DNA_ORIENTATION=-
MLKNHTPSTQHRPTEGEPIKSREAYVEKAAITPLLPPKQPGAMGRETSDTCLTCQEVHDHPIPVRDPFHQPTLAQTEPPHSRSVCNDQDAAVGRGRSGEVGGQPDMSRGKTRKQEARERHAHPCPTSEAPIVRQVATLTTLEPLGGSKRMYTNKEIHQSELQTQRRWHHCCRAVGECVLCGSHRIAETPCLVAQTSGDGPAPHRSAGLKAPRATDRSPRVKPMPPTKDETRTPKKEQSVG